MANLDLSSLSNNILTKQFCFRFIHGPFTYWKKKYCPIGVSQLAINKCNFCIYHIWVALQICWSLLWVIPLLTESDHFTHIHLKKELYIHKYIFFVKNGTKCKINGVNCLHVYKAPSAHLLFYIFSLINIPF